MKYYLTSLIAFFLILMQTQAQEASGIIIQEDYNRIAFIEFAEAVEDRYDVQIYFFTGWVKDLKIKQNSSPLSLNDILTNTFADTDFSFYLNNQRQVILTYDSEIRNEFKLLDSAELATEEQKLTEVYAGSPQSSDPTDDFESK